jgi:hypothetical protein
MMRKGVENDEKRGSKKTRPRAERLKNDVKKR